ncbi:MAG TPA: NAD(P)-binding protein, partial [Leptospiraceae bacterium]|nr:NAD(P)-binding protein [Leptospiraceae bacterium]
MKVAVIGAGPAGVTAAYLLVKGGAQVDLYEASGDVGGLARSINLWNQRVDLGPHRFFSSDTRVNELWLELARQDFEMVDRLTRIFYKNKFFFYPLKPFNALFNLGPIESVLCFLSYLKEKVKPTPDDGSFETWVTGRFGKKFFIIFFKTYSEKLWGISCKDLDAEFAAQRIKKLSLWEAVKNALFGGRGNKHKTLVDQFAYPSGGTGMIYERMAD